jgi:hypothetical protein
MGGPAVATEVSTPELSALAAAAAAGDATARTSLAAVTEVDGRPVAGARLLEGRPTDVDRRLETLASLTTAGSGVDPDRARAEAASILAGAEYQRGDPTPPGWLQRFTEWLADLIPGEIGEVLFNRVLWILLASIAVATVVFFLIRNAARRRRGEFDREGAPHGEMRRTATGLEQHARRAADAGDYGTAVRLWFEAGAIRLADRGLLTHDTTSTSGAVRRAVPTATMARLTTTFDRVAYGKRIATAEDADAAEEGWTAVATELVPHE